MNTDPLEIQPGSVVKLKSGGPKMVVGTNGDDKGNVRVFWTNTKDKLEHADVPRETLRIVPGGEI